MAKFSSIFFFLAILVSPMACDEHLPEVTDLPVMDVLSDPLIITEQLIRSLNLTPKHASSCSGDGRNMVMERMFRFASESPEETRRGGGAEELRHHAGYYHLPHTHDSRMFYFFFESSRDKKDPVVLWLTGGPGCGGEIALFYENGPFKLKNNISVDSNEFGWDRVSNLIYVDQPIGTGFSYSSDERDVRHDERGVADDLFDFLQVFMTKHPEYVGNDFYITGESYAGHYIPALATRIRHGNKAKEGIHINLKGLAIGNGLTHPAIQYGAYADYALMAGIIEESDHKQISKIYPACELAIKLCGTSGTATCLAAYMICNSMFSSIMKIVGNLNYYDIRKACNGRLCYDFSSMEEFLSQRSVREALGVGSGVEFVPCSTAVSQAMLTDWMRNLEVDIPAMLEDGVELLIYAGEYDLICNWLGNWRWVHSMKWYGQKDFASSIERPFVVDGSEAGVLKSYGPVSFLKVRDAGHMVPMDQPKAALEMIKRWTAGGGGGLVNGEDDIDDRKVAAASESPGAMHACAAHDGWKRLFI